MPVTFARISLGYSAKAGDIDQSVTHFALFQVGQIFALSPLHWRKAIM
jgi:hypothetical protein